MTENSENKKYAVYGLILLIVLVLGFMFFKKKNPTPNPVTPLPTEIVATDTKVPFTPIIPTVVVLPTETIVPTEIVVKPTFTVVINPTDVVTYTVEPTTIKYRNPTKVPNDIFGKCEYRDIRCLIVGDK